MVAASPNDPEAKDWSSPAAVVFRVAPPNPMLVNGTEEWVTLPLTSEKATMSTARHFHNMVYPPRWNGWSPVYWRLIAVAVKSAESQTRFEAYSVPMVTGESLEAIQPLKCSYRATLDSTSVVKVTPWDSESSHDMACT